MWFSLFLIYFRNDFIQIRVSTDALRANIHAARRAYHYSPLAKIKQKKSANFTWRSLNINQRLMGEDYIL
jgi:hypothetical protein